MKSMYLSLRYSLLALGVIIAFGVRADFVPSGPIYPVYSQEQGDDVTHEWTYVINGTDVSITGVNPAIGDIEIPYAFSQNGRWYHDDDFDHLGNGELMLMTYYVRSIGDAALRHCASST